MSQNHWLLLLSGALATGLSAGTFAAEPSSCVTCHLDESLLTRNLSTSTAKKSAMQSGAG
jgi:hypothetical protein